MLLRTELCLRTAAIGCRMQPSISTPCNFSTTSGPRKSQLRDVNPTPRRSSALGTANGFQSSLMIVRYASSIQSPESAGPSASGTTAASYSSPSDKLDWNTYFKLKKSRRRLQLGTSVGTSLAGMAGGMQALAMSDMDAIVGQIPLDPIISLGLITFACGGLGWLVGPVVGTGIFNTMNRKHIAQMTTKEKEFYSRIKRYRVDPSASSMANPVPDYYGERISSVQGYRQWLKDQRAFNKKRQTFVS